jgi:hypothetical protein
VQFNDAGNFGGDSVFRFISPSLFLGAGAPGTNSIQQGTAVLNNLFINTGNFQPNGGQLPQGYYIRLGNIVVIGWEVEGDVTTAGGGNVLQINYDIAAPVLTAAAGSGGAVRPSAITVVESGGVPAIPVTLGGFTRIQSGTNTLNFTLSFRTAHVLTNVFLSGMVMYETSAPA